MADIHIEQCTFAYHCPRTWDALLSTNVDSVRFCDQCERNVFLCSDSGEAHSHAAKGHCVAIPITLTDHSKRVLCEDNIEVGVLNPPTGAEYERHLTQGKHAGFDTDFLGIDGCPDGWFYFGISASGDFRFGVFSNFDEVAKALAQAELVLLDMPIGLPSEGSGPREVDRLARRAIRPRSSSVFSVPARTAVNMPNYRLGSAENHRVLGKKLSKQSWAIAPKIREVDEFMRARHPNNIREMHPEVAFWALNGGAPMQHNKKTDEGQAERLRVLRRHFPQVEACFDLARQAFLKKEAASDDIIDAMVGAVTASLAPRWRTLPEDPAIDEEGLPMEMVYADLT